MKFLNKIKKSFKAIGEIFKNPWLLNRILSDDYTWEIYLKKKHKNHQALPVIDILDLSPDLTETIKTFTFLEGGSLPTDIALLQILAKKFKNCNYFEIGTWRGESVVNVANFAQQCYTLNLSKEELIKRGVNTKQAELQGFFSKGKENIIHLFGNSTTYNFGSLNKKFDLIFIDGDHHYEFVKNDTEKVFQHLIHDNSIIVWHDYSYTSEKIRPEVLAGILDGIPEVYKKNLFHVSNTLCAVFIRETFRSKELIRPIVPDKKFTVTIGAEKL